MYACKKNAYISSNIYYTIKSEDIWFTPNLTGDFIEVLIVYVLLFVAEIYGFQFFADVSI